MDGVLGAGVGIDVERDALLLGPVLVLGEAPVVEPVAKADGPGDAELYEGHEAGDQHGVDDDWPDLPEPLGVEVRVGPAEDLSEDGDAALLLVGRREQEEQAGIEELGD